MAHLAPTKLTCSACGFSGSIKVVVGTGPHSRKGDIPYRRYMEPGPFIKHLTPEGKKTGALMCPDCGTPVWADQDGARAFGPITKAEHQRNLRQNAPRAPGNGKNPFGVTAQGPSQPRWLKKRKRIVKRSP